MDNTTNGWDIWYSRLDPEWSDEVIPQADLQAWGEEFQRLVRLSDHSGYAQNDPMPLEEAMTMAFVLDQAGIHVEALLDLCRAYSPFALSDMVSIPLCFLLDPLGHVDGLLEQMQEMSEMSESDLEQIRQGIEAMGGPVPDDTDALLDVFRNGLLNMIHFLTELQRILGEFGVVTLNAWWQGRLISLLREETENQLRPKKRVSKSKGKGGAVPDAFLDLIQGLDLDGDPPTPSGKY
jgi:hypothetical protein